MTAHRRPTIAFSDAPRGSCRWCGEPILYDAGPKSGEIDRRRRWHPACVETYNASDPREVRRRLRKRDRGVCARCGLDTYRLRREFRGRGMTRALRERGFKPRQSLWEVDHIVALIDGGGHDLANLQTLCTPCHKEKTAAEARERAGRAGAPAPPGPAGGRAEDDRSTGADRPSAPAPADLEVLLERAAELNDRVTALLRDMRAGAGG